MVYIIIKNLIEKKHKLKLKQSQRFPTESHEDPTGQSVPIKIKH